MMFQGQTSVYENWNVFLRLNASGVDTVIACEPKSSFDAYVLLKRSYVAICNEDQASLKQNMERQSATSLQATWRASVTRHDYVARRSSVITVQSVFRRRCASREVAVKRETLRRRTIAAVQIQRNVRGHNVRAALRTAKEDAAARVIEKLMRWYMNRAQLRLHRLRKDNVRNIWHDLAQESSGEAGISSLLRDYPMFDRNEAAVHAALFAAFARRNFDEAVDLVQSHAAEGDPRARYLRALAMRLGGRGAPATLIQIVGRGKQLELDERLREERVTPRVFFGPGRTTALPCMEELEFLLRLAVQMATDPHERAKRICVHGVFRHLVVKDTDGAERMLLEAATLTPEDPFVTMCFYGRAAAPDEPLPSPGLCEEDFAGSGALCVLVRHGLQIRDFDGVRVAVLERRSKHGRVDLMFSLSLQSLSLTEEKGHEKGGGDSGRESEGMARKTLIVTHSQLREWASFLDQPDALNASADPKRALALYEELVDSLDIVRTDREEATWNSVQPALRFKQRPVGTRVQLTRNRHLLSLTFFLEEQQRLRITAYCAALDDTFAVVLGKTQIEALCIDSPLLKRMFAERGWRRATHFSPLLDRVAGLLEVCDPPPETPRYLSYTRSDQMLVNNRIVKRPFKQQYNSLGLTSGKYLKISGLEDAMRAARRNWAAERIQSLFHLQRAYDAYYAAVLDRAAVGLQRLWRGHCARLANASHRAEARRHRAASRLAAFGHGIRQRKALRSRIRHVVGDAASGDWHAYWCAAAVQRRCGGALYASIFTSDLDADVNFEGLRVCNGDFALARELYFERALRMQPEAPRPCIAYALATMEFTDDYEEALRLLARAEALGPVHPKFYDWLESRQRIRAEAVVKVQRMWRFTRNLPRYSFLLATEMACAQRAIDLGVATVDDWESLVFGLQALHCDEVAANDVYERTLLRKFPGRASFRLGHAVLHRLDSVDAHPSRSDLGGILRYFRHACLAQDPQKLAPALANLALLYWYLNVCDEAESLVPLSRRLRLERLAEKRVKDEILARARECEEMAKHDKPPPNHDSNT
ncbi:Myosin-14 [Hondaea fermentalgiana]|uniref:Myosin-14 n=1 Tax=Hondaea fermentalgiana TaxID=2315210 RepID=A0A2R5GG75_9STRA|nr:Myosin-14 [Hondaea fermentalgiana]|eukprot:GBG29912.1 Myosin-14 [Hondaea fermentalgiana]